jgi:Phytanoyl-CoA dioxygenase (PhyH)
MLEGLSTVPSGRLLALQTKALLDARWRAPLPKVVDTATRQRLDELERSGICVVPGFLSVAECADLRAEVDAVMQQHAELVTVDRAGADERLFLGATPSGRLGDIFSDPVLLAAARGVLGRDVTNVALLAGRMRATPRNRGSGGGWHRDSYTNQFKSMIYLTDVDERSGPIQFIEGSHRTRAKAEDDRRMDMPLGRRPRYSRAQIGRLVDGDRQRVRTVVAPAGTLILVDTTGIHRGKPIRRGQRYALVNYFYPTRLAESAGFRPRFTVLPADS